MTTSKRKSSVKNILHYLVLTLTLLTLVACGGGGETTQTPSTTTYSLAFNSGGNGTLTGTSSQAIVQAGSSSVVTAVPATGYHFVNWTEGASVVGTNVALTVTDVSANHSYTANFALNSQIPSTATYTLSFVAGGNGTLTGTADQTVNQGASSGAVTAVPASGYHFVNWTEGGSIAGVNAALAVTNVTANHSYTANFAIDTQVKTTAILAINLTGTLPASTAIAGAMFTLTLPPDVTPAITNGAVINGVVTPSGVFAGGTLTPPVYTAATASAPGTLIVTLVNSNPTGLTQVGEVATISLQLANGVTPTAANFGLSAVSVIDATLYNTISGMSANVASVTLQ